MVGHHEVATVGDGLVDNGLGGIETNDRPGGRGRGFTGDKPGVVVTLLVRWWGDGFEMGDDLL